MWWYKVISFTIWIYEHWFISFIRIQDQDSLFLGDITVINRTRAAQRAIFLTWTVHMIRFEVRYTLIFTIWVIVTFNNTFAFKVSHSIALFQIVYLAHMIWLIQVIGENSLVINYFSKRKNQNFRRKHHYNSKLGCCSSCNHQCNQCGTDTNRCILQNSDCNPSRNRNLFHMK